jgi:hypothetical protein
MAIDDGGRKGYGIADQGRTDEAIDWDDHEVKKEEKAARGVASWYLNKATGRVTCPKKARQTQRGCDIAGAEKSHPLAISSFISIKVYFLSSIFNSRASSKRLTIIYRVKLVKVS